ncbi:MAG: RHS repeat-associated core domain-containing protein [Planctomycetota bacterium]
MAARAQWVAPKTYNGLPAASWKFDGLSAEMFAYEQAGIARARVKHASGSIVDFEPGLTLPTGETLYRATGVIDTFGRALQRHFDGIGRLIRINYPTGAVEHWTWNESLIPGLSHITVTYDIDQDGIADEPGPEFEARWGMEFQHRNGLTRPFSDIPPTRIFYPATPYVTAPSQAELFNTTPQTAYHVVEIAYQDLALPGLPSIPRPYAVYEYRHATLFGSIGALPPHIGKVEYAALNGRMRVTGFVDRHGAQTDFAYTQFSGPQSEWVAEVVTTDPRGTGRITYLDSEGRTSRIKVQPSPSTLPRQADPYFSSLGLSEPASLEWEFVYASSGGCGCGKPIEIRSPGIGGVPRVERWTYDDWGFPLTHTYPNPSTASSPAELTDTYTWLRATSNSTLNHSPTLLGSFTNPNGTWTGTLTWHSTAGTFHNKPATYQLTSPTIHSVDGTPSTVTTTTEWNSLGWPTRSVDGDGVAREFLYALPGNPDPGTGLPIEVEELPASGTGPSVVTKFTWDALGRLVTKIDSATSTLALTTTFENDALGRVLAAQSIVADTDPFGNAHSVLHRSEYLRDMHGNVAVHRIRNRDSADAPPTRHGQSATTAREWIRTDRHYAGSRLLRMFADRRALDRDENGALSDDPDARMLESVYSYYPTGDLHQISLPNGATLTRELDGYGTTWQTSIANATSTVVEERYFIDAALDVIKVHRGDHAAGLDLWTTIQRQSRTGLVNTIVEPLLAAAPPGYTGSLGGAAHVFTRDSSGRETLHEVFDGSTLLAKTEREYDEISRLRRLEDHALGAGPQDIYEVKRRFAGMSLLKEVELPGSRITKFDYDALGRRVGTEDSLAPTSNRQEFDYLSGTHFVSLTRSRVIKDNLAVADSAHEFHSRYVWDPLGRLRRYEELGENGVGDPRVQAFWYYTTGDTQWSIAWKGSSQPTFGSTGSREHHYLPDARGRLIEHALLGDNTGTTTDDILLSLAHVDWTDAQTCISRVDRFDGVGNRTSVHRDFAGRFLVEQRPGAASYLPTAIAQDHTIAVIDYDSASRPLGWTHGTPIAGQMPRTELFFDGNDELLVRQFPNVNSFPFHSFLATREVFDRDSLGRVAKHSTFAGDLSALSLVDAVSREEDSLGRVHAERYDFGILDDPASDLWSVTATFDATLRDRRASVSYQGGLDMGLRWDSIGRMAGIDWDPAGSSQLLADYGHFGGQTAWRSLAPKDASADTRIETIYRFDTLGRLDRITDSRTGTTPAAIDDYEFVYDDFGNLVEERYNRFDGNSATTNAGDGFTYDRFHRLQEAVLGSNTLPPSQNPGTFLSALTYDLDHAGNRETLTTTPGSGTPSTETYTSAANRYTQVQPTIPTTLLYDGRGNLIFDGTRYYVYDFKDRLSEIWLLVADEVPAETTALVAADAFEEQEAQAPLGSVAPLQAARETILAAMTAPPSSGEEVARMQFYGALTEPVTLPYGTPIQTQSGVQYAQQSSTTTSLQLVALYGYDTGNRRVARVAVAQAATWLHVYDGWREIQELSVDASTGVKRIAKEFVWGSRLDELVAYRRNDAAVGQPPSWTTYHTTQCGHECILSVIDSTGQLAERAMYDPYGRVTVYAPDDTLIGNAFQSGLPMSWKAHRMETEAPFVYMRNRHYSPGLGRFLSIDRIGAYGDSLNHGNGYTYGGDAPTLISDPMGLQGDKLAWGHLIGDRWKGKPEISGYDVDSPSNGVVHLQSNEERLTNAGWDNHVDDYIRSGNGKRTPDELRKWVADEKANGPFSRYFAESVPAEHPYRGRGRFRNSKHGAYYKAKLLAQYRYMLMSALRAANEARAICDTSAFRPLLRLGGRILIIIPLLSLPGNVRAHGLVYGVLNAANPAPFDLPTPDDIDAFLKEMSDLIDSASDYIDESDEDWREFMKEEGGYGVPNPDPLAQLLRSLGF